MKNWFALCCIIVLDVVFIPHVSSSACNSVFYECSCSETDIKCNRPNKVTEFPATGEVFPDVKTIHIEEATFTTLNSSHLHQFPNLIILTITRSRLHTVTDDAFGELSKLKELDLSYNHIPTFPIIAGLRSLDIVNLQGNRIGSVSYNQVKGCFGLLKVLLNYNNIETLESGTFADSCRLSALNISHNDLNTIADDFFEGLHVQVLDLSYTRISHLPMKGLQLLEELNLEGCTKLHQFPLAEGEHFNEQLCTNKTFPFLSKVRFEYHAHCCSYSSFKPLQQSIRGGNNPCKATADEHVLNVTLVSPSLSSTVSADVSPSSINLLTTSTATVCWNGMTLISHGSSTRNGIATTSAVFPQSSPIAEECCTTMDIVISPTSIVSEISCTSHNMPSMVPTPTESTIVRDDCSYFDNFHECVVCTTIDHCQSQNCQKYLSVCNAKNRRKRSNDSIRNNRYKRFDSVAGSSISKACIETTTINVLPSVLSYTLVCNSTHSASSVVLPTSTLGSGTVLSTSTLATSMKATMTSTTPSPTETMLPDCSQFPNLLECIYCTTVNFCFLPNCQQYSSICQSTKRKKRSVKCLETECASANCIDLRHICHYNRIKRNLDIAPSCSSCTVSAVLTFIPIPTTYSNIIDYSTTSQTSASSAVLSPASVMRLSGSPSPTCTRFRVLGPEWYFENSSITASCYPNNDPFNPCFHILDDDILRGAIWIVLFVALIGNGIVITVTILHWILRYKSYKKEPNLLYVLYLNLAFADFFMGLYLVTIASIDVETKGHYSSEAIDWQTGPGCDFAGFCAIFSSILSVYTLLFITVERVYSIKFALQMKHFKKKWVFIFMCFGWMLAILLGILPIFGMSSFGRVSICLPFENRGIEDKAYIAVVLIVTGIASFAILFSYVYLFYLVGCSGLKEHLTRSLSGKEELKLALRMSLLILTDFATWGPIALFGLTAAFGFPLINDIKAAKVLMVFVFPLNSCLNPVLYSFSTRLFRNNVVSLSRKLGLCRVCDKLSKSSVMRSSTSSDKNNSSRLSNNEEKHTEYHGRRRSTQISLMSRLTSISSLGSDTGSRRGSTLSGSSLEDGIPPPNTDNLPVILNGIGSRPLSKSSWDSTGSLPNTTTKRLTSLPEEDELDVSHIINIHRKDSTDSNNSISFHKATINKEVAASNIVSNGNSRRRQSLPTILDNTCEDIELEKLKPITNTKIAEMVPDENNEIQEVEVTFY